jgi:hypothetical protein
MLLTLAAFLLPPLFVFGVYHMLTWFNVFHINDRVYWKRVALASAVSHILLLTGFLVFSWFEAAGAPYGPFLFSGSQFTRLLRIFDTAAMFVILLVFSAFARAEVNPPGLLLLTFAITYVIGTTQWFLVGGGIGALLERFWSGLKTPDDVDEEWL